MKVLLAENLPATEPSLKGLLELQGMHVLMTTNGIDAVRTAFSENPDVIILDSSIEGLDPSHCTRIFKNDPFMRETPVILTGSASGQIDRFWTMTSGTDYFLQRPIDSEEITGIIKSIVAGRGVKGGPHMAPASITPVLQDTDILSMANSILDRALFKSSLLSEMNSIDVETLQADLVIKSVFEMLSSLYNFTAAAALFYGPSDGEIYFYTGENYPPPPHRRVQGDSLRASEGPRRRVPLRARCRRDLG